MFHFQDKQNPHVGVHKVINHCFLPLPPSIHPALFQMARTMEAPSATTVSGSLLSPRRRASQAPAAPIHRKARISTRDLPRGAAVADSMGSWAVGEEKR